MTASRCAAARSTRASHSPALHSSRLICETWNCMANLLANVVSVSSQPPLPAASMMVLSARRKRPRGCRAAKRANEFSPSDVDCHATLPWGSCPCNMEGRYHALIARSVTTSHRKGSHADKSRPARRRLHAAITDEGAASGDGGPTRTVGLWSRRIGDVAGSAPMADDLPRRGSWGLGRGQVARGGAPDWESGLYTKDQRNPDARGLEARPAAGEGRTWHGSWPGKKDCAAREIFLGVTEKARPPEGPGPGARAHRRHARRLIIRGSRSSQAMQTRATALGSTSESRLLPVGQRGA